MRGAEGLRNRGAVPAFMLILLLMLPATLSGQQDPRLVSAVRLAQEGQSDSARKVAGRLLVSLQPTDSLYPEVLYTLGILAATEEERRLYLRRVIVDHSVSPWADDALLSMVQLEYATGNTEGAARDAERLVRDYPGSPVSATGALWGARAAGDRRDAATACRLADAGLQSVGTDIELRNQLEFQRQRCTGLVAMTEQAARRDSAAAARETSRTDTPPAPPARRSGWYVQFSAVRTRAAGDQELRRLARVDYPGVVLQESGLYKVRAGPFATRQEAASALTKIKARLGGTPFVTRVP
jgi:hypothetical protein